MPNDLWSPAAWNDPIFDEFRDLLNAFSDWSNWPTLSELETTWLAGQQVTTVSGVPLRIMRQEAGRRRERPRLRRDLYDVSVCGGALPTRPCNWHDFFNVLMFAAFPRSKGALHALHCRILEQRLPEQLRALPGARTREQDHLAMLDEGGVLLAVDPANLAHVTDWLCTAQHDRLCVAIAQGEVRPWLLGHAHHEHLAIQAVSKCELPMPRAKPVLVQVGVRASRSEVDAALEALLTSSTDMNYLVNGWRAVSLEHLRGNVSALTTSHAN